MGQRYSFGFSDSFIAEIGKITLKQLHFDAVAIKKAYDKLKDFAEELGIKLPTPRLAGFCYTHIASLGANIEFPESSEPKPFPLISSPDEIDKLKEPADYLSSPIIQKKLNTLKELKKLCPETPDFIGHLLEGPITTAVLILSQEFLTLPYDNPQKAHEFLEFSTESALNYAKAITEYFGRELKSNGFPDDFAGMFPPDIFKEFVVPYWKRLYEGLKSEIRTLHSELLRVEHLPFLKELNVEYFDPGVDQYLKPEDLYAHCPCKCQLRITSWQIDNLSADSLVNLYIKLAQYHPYVISFSIHRLKNLDKIKKLLEIARKMEKEDG